MKDEKWHNCNPNVTGSMKKQYLAALPCFPNSKGFNHRTILVSAININEARVLVRHLRPNDNIGEIKEVNNCGKI